MRSTTINHLLVPPWIVESISDTDQLSTDLDSVSPAAIWRQVLVYSGFQNSLCFRGHPRSASDADHPAKLPPCFHCDVFVWCSCPRRDSNSTHTHMLLWLYWNRSRNYGSCMYLSVATCELLTTSHASDSQPSFCQKWWSIFSDKSMRGGCQSCLIVSSCTVAWGSDQIILGPNTLLLNMSSFTKLVQIYRWWSLGTHLVVLEWTAASATDVIPA